MQSVSLKLGRPSAGWLPIEIKIGDFDCSFEASDLGLNIIDQMVDMVSNLNTGKNSQCYFYLEPGAYIMDVELKSDVAILQMQFVEDFNHQDISVSETQFRGEVSQTAFRTSLLSALQAFDNFNYEVTDWPIPEKSILLKQIIHS